jgi:putative colanic acid biosynthesis acetyltransferase WcaF
MSRARSDHAATDNASPETRPARAPAFWRRVLWRFALKPLFPFTFHNAYTLRNAMLRAAGATIESTVRIRPSCDIRSPWGLRMDRKSALGDVVTILPGGRVHIGSRSVISQYCLVCPVTFPRPGSAPDMPPADIVLGDDVWIATESVVCGGIDVPAGVVVGARSVVSRDLEPWTIAAGSPAKSLKPRPYRRSGARTEVSA